MIRDDLFLWSLHEDDLNAMHIVAHDKRLNLRYGRHHGAFPDGENYVDVMGPRFNGLPPGLQGWLRVQAPSWSDNEYIAPRFVRKLILWALEPKAKVIYKVLPHGFSTHVVTMSPWHGGLLSFSASPGEANVYEPATEQDRLTTGCN